MTDTLGSNWSKMQIENLNILKWNLIKLKKIIYFFLLIQQINCYEFNDINPSINKINHFNYTLRSVRSSIAQDNLRSNHVTHSESKSRIQSFPDLLGNKKNNIYQEEIIYSSHPFNFSNLSDFKEILIDYENENVYVSAKDFLIKFSYEQDQLKIKDGINDIIHLGEYNSDYCHEKPCHNYINLLGFYSRNNSKNDQIFFCGTNTIKTFCSRRSAASLKETLENMDGIGRISKSPNIRSTFVSLPNGDIYFGTNVEYENSELTSDFLITRNIGPSNTLRTNPYNSNWLNEPVFVASLTIGDYVYFFIRENALEYMNFGGKIVSRVVRVCKHEKGVTNHDEWKSFEKAKIDCYLPSSYQAYSNNFNVYLNQNQEKKYPFFFEEIQDVFYDEKKKLIYAIFNTPLNGMKGSAVCVYNMESFEAAFQGPFTHQKSPTSIWEPSNQKLETPKCEPPNKFDDNKRSSHNFIISNQFPLKHLSIKPVNEMPQVVLENNRLIKIAIDNIDTKNENIDVLFAATESNTIQKYTLLSNGQRQPSSCLIEEIDLFEPNKQSILNSINNIAIIGNSQNRYLLIASSFSLIKLKLSNCESQSTYFGCLNTMDPYCVWDSRDQSCLSIFKIQTQESLSLNKNLHQHAINTCPLTKTPVNGGFSSWGPWVSCRSKTGENCKCRMRLCNNPEPRNGGKNCDENESIEILDCEINGGWTEWSDWSACKINSMSICEPNSVHKNPVVIRTRTRSCTNPSPRFNGRLCVGAEKEEEICTHEMINPCHSNSQWSSWGAWEACSKSCGEGFQMRRRVCNGRLCTGCNQEWRTCNSHRCPDQKSSILTEWENIDFNNDTLQKLDKRSKFICELDPDADITQAKTLNLSASVEYRLCKDNKICQSIKDLKELGLWNEWTDWSECKSCHDEQKRTRKCIHGTCFGSHEETKKCECRSSVDQLGWSCWSDFSPCSVSCGNGFQKRSRICLNGQKCEGKKQEIISCVARNCTHTKSLMEKISEIDSQEEFKFSLYHLTFVGIVTFLLGSCLVLIISCLSIKKNICCCCFRKKKRKTNKNFTIENSEDATGSSCTTENAKFSSNSSETGSHSVSSNHSKEYFTIGNRFDPTGISSLLNDILPDEDDDEEMINTTITSGTLKKTKQNNQKMNTLGLPTKSFNTYVNHKDFNKNSNSLLNNGNSSILSSNSVNMSIGTGTLRFGNFSNLNGSATLKSIKNQRTSFALPMRTNLDQEL